jgi:hypothetical protein
MPTVGVYDDQGVKVYWENLKQHFGSEVASLIQSSDPYPAELSGIDASPSRLTGIKYHCMAKPFMKKRLNIFVYYKSFWPMIRGTIVHAGIQLPDKERIIKAEFDGRDGRYVVGGVMDGYDESDETVWEVKTSSWLPEKPKDEHIYQTMIYKFMGSIVGFEVKKVKFIYCSDKTWKVFEVWDVPLIKPDELENDIKLYWMCRDTRMDGPKPDAMKWVCAYCDFWRYCPYSRMTFKRAHSRVEKINKPSCRIEDNVVDVETALKETPRRVI